ncbi:hypothetical protein VCHA50P415_30317 [Vibrio chagasii]|nr:hypothetical protein VCHA34O109_160058 [Vibrio chagasii]CAH6847612.1 hypothetical protein VCHA35O142_10621 [Vibrio chagasii]CAH6849866.1 hypothetical protein VCHA36P164_10410 [Vibrio chagasii]CAH6883065.1 hypothetical protein VCHA34P121_20357 [Vibrio chagasii]CAH6892819.1 hypothetical protein VCHA34P114_30333 [Vibrio chagasii]
MTTLLATLKLIFLVNFIGHYVFMEGIGLLIGHKVTFLLIGDSPKLQPR